MRKTVNNMDSTCPFPAGEGGGSASALERARQIYAGREQEIRAIKEKTGRPVIGYLCCFAPPEIIAAAGALPYRITGLPGDATAAADAYMEPYGCTYVRNIMAQTVKGRLDFLDGLVISHSCDMVQRLYGLWTYYRPLAYSRLFNVPHQLTPWSQRFFKRELHFFRESLEKFTGNAVTERNLRETVELYNRSRSLVRELYRLRGERPPRLRGSEMLELLLAGGVLPAADFSGLLEEALKEVRARVKIGTESGPRLLVWGSLLDDPALYKMIEAAGGHVAADDNCIGFRTWDQDVPLPDDVYEGLKEHYLVNFQCPRTDRGPGVKRFAYILERARAYHVQGVVGYIISFCDPHKFDYPDLRDLLKASGLPMLLIDDNYSLAPAGAVETRLQAFVEMLQ